MQASKKTTLGFALWLWALSARLAYAQSSQTVTDAVSPPEIGSGLPAGSYSMSDIDYVDPYSGSVYIKIPLLTVGGRGEVRYPLYLQLQSKWTLHGNVNSGQQVFWLGNPGSGGLSPWDPLLQGVAVSREAIVDPSAPPTDCTYTRGSFYITSPSLQRLLFLRQTGVSTNLLTLEPAGSR